VVSPLVTGSLVLVAKKTMPAKDLNDLIAWLKANPNKASAGIISGSVHLLTALFQKETATRVALVPYRGGAPGMQDLVAGQIDLSFVAPFQLSLVRAGSIKAYAVTSDTRLTLAPDIPTFGEMGLPALSYSIWTGLCRWRSALQPRASLPHTFSSKPGRNLPSCHIAAK
jgi:tripartite-type tricarboxylate transporter receptor subunit TctC